MSKKINLNESSLASLLCGIVVMTQFPPTIPSDNKFKQCFAAAFEARLEDLRKFFTLDSIYTRRDVNKLNEVFEVMQAKKLVITLPRVADLKVSMGPRVAADLLAQMNLEPQAGEIIAQIVKQAFEAYRKR